MVSRSNKFVRLGLARTDPNVDADDLPGTTLSISNINVISPTFSTSNTVEADVTNQLSQQLTETIELLVDGTVKDSKSVTFSSGESKTVQLTFFFAQRGDNEVVVQGGGDSDSTTVTLSLI